MWFLIVALASIASSLVVGRWLARAASEQTNPRPVRGPSLAATMPADRLAIAANAARLRTREATVHLN